MAGSGDLSRIMVALVCLGLLLTKPGMALWLDECNRAIGMESRLIPDEAITASSSHNVIVGPQYARVRVEDKGGAWCPRDQVDSNSREYLEINLGKVFVVTTTGTQGRFGNGFGQEYTESYRIEYWRPGLQEYVKYVDGYNNQTLRGNRNTYTEQKTVLSPPIIASKVRFIPFSTHLRTICLRVELYGCNHTNGLLGYSSHNGQIRNPGFLFQDDSYDGEKRGEYLNFGLGQLYDGEVASSLTNLGLVGFRRGWEWVGWPNNQAELNPNEAKGSSPLHITFIFDEMRNFSQVVFHAFFAPEKGFVLPSMAEVFFSEDGKYFEKHPLRVTFMPPESKREVGLNISMNLQHRPGKILKAQLHFPPGWMVLSEVYFESERCDCNISDWSPNEASAPAERTADRDGSIDVSTVSAVQGNSRAYIGLVIGFIIFLSLLVVAGLFLYVGRFRRKKSSPHSLKSPLSDSGSVTFDMRSLRLTTSYSGAGVSMYGPVGMPEEDGSFYHEPYKTPLFSASDYSVATIGKQFNEYTEGLGLKRKAQSMGEYAIPILSSPPAPFNTSANNSLTSVSNAPFNAKSNISFNMNNNNPYNTSPISAPTTPFSQGTSSPNAKYSNSNGVLSSNQNGIFPSLLRIGPATLPVPPVPPPPEKYLSPPQICTNIDILSPFGTVLFQMEGGTTLKNRSPREISRQAVHLAEKIGDGEFGSVYNGDIKVPNVENSDSTPGQLAQSSRQVVVCTLFADSPPEEKKIAWRQAQILASLHDPHLECLLGCVSRDEPLLLLLENPTLGDLNQYLRRHVPDTTTPRLNHMRAISYGSLLYIATQIASGMKYLESHNIVHRDLATRNIHVEPGQLVKIGSFGSCRSLYAGDYYKATVDDDATIRLPIRWMSWEAAFLGNFSNKSDVFAFGITLWEILTLARQQPFEKMTDDGVIENLAHYHHNDDEQILLGQPAFCPKEIYDMMNECWRRCSQERPNFRDIHLFLQRKNHGFSPMD